MSFVRKILLNTVHVPVSRKAPAIMAVVLLLSILSWLDVSPPSSWLSDKGNAVNSLLVKWSWAWSLLCLAPSVMLTAFFYSGLQWREVMGHFSRLLVAHCVWLLVTRAFVSLDSVVGVCSDGSGRGRGECLQEGSSWAGFDISGHVFLLTYCVYLLTEEVSGLRLEVWGEFEGSLQLEHRALSKPQLSWARKVLPHLHTVCSPLAQGLELLAAALMTVWVAMLFSTSLYFHSVPEKLLGGVCSWLAWVLTYSWLYGRAYLPRRPDQGLLYPPRHHRLYDNTETS